MCIDDQERITNDTEILKKRIKILQETINRINGVEPDNTVKISEADSVLINILREVNCESNRVAIVKCLSQSIEIMEVKINLCGILKRNAKLLSPYKFDSMDSYIEKTNQVEMFKEFCEKYNLDKEDIDVQLQFVTGERLVINTKKG